MLPTGPGHRATFPFCSRPSSWHVFVLPSLRPPRTAGRLRSELGDNYCHQARLIGGCSNHGLGIVYMEPVQPRRNMREGGQMKPCAPFISPTNLADINLTSPSPLLLIDIFPGNCNCSQGRHPEQGGEGRSRRGAHGQQVWGTREGLDRYNLYTIAYRCLFGQGNKNRQSGRREEYLRVCLSFPLPARRAPPQGFATCPRRVCAVTTSARVQRKADLLGRAWVPPSLQALLHPAGLASRCFPRRAPVSPAKAAGERRGREACPASALCAPTA